MFCRLAVAPPLAAHAPPDHFLDEAKILKMKPRFEPDSRSGENDGLAPTLIDPEAYDASEQTFAASLEQTVSSKPPRFVVEKEASDMPAETAPQSQ